MYQNGTDWADGVPGITQCPIPAHSSFTYQFTVTGQHGTYWYHTHTSNNMADGLLVSYPALLRTLSNAAVTRDRWLSIVRQSPTAEGGTTIMRRSSCWVIGCE